MNGRGHGWMLGTSPAHIIRQTNMPLYRQEYRYPRDWWWRRAWVVNLRLDCCAVWVCADVCMFFVCLHVYVYVFVFVYMCVCVCICDCVCVCVCSCSNTFKIAGEKDEHFRTLDVQGEFRLFTKSISRIRSEAGFFLKFYSHYVWLLIFILIHSEM